MVPTTLIFRSSMVVQLQLLSLRLADTFHVIQMVIPMILFMLVYAVPVFNSLFDVSNFAKVQSAIKDGFVVRWVAANEDCMKCQKSGGFCGYDSISKQTTSYCRLVLILYQILMHLQVCLNIFANFIFC
jgi:hypothetical protein